MPPLDHLAALSDNVGVIQHATESVPNRKTGYCSDDVTRAFMVAVAYANLFPQDLRSRRLASVYLAFLHHAQLEDGRFHNFMEYDRRWSDTLSARIVADASCGRSATVWLPRPSRRGGASAVPCSTARCRRCRF